MLFLNIRKVGITAILLYYLTVFPKKFIMIITGTIIGHTKIKTFEIYKDKQLFTVLMI